MTGSYEPDGFKRTLRALTRKAVVNRGMNGSIAERFGASLIPMRNPVDGFWREREWAREE